MGVDVDEDVEVGLAFQKNSVVYVVNDPQQSLVNEFTPIGMPALYYIYQGQILKVRFEINNISKVITEDLVEMGVEL